MGRLAAFIILLILGTSGTLAQQDSTRQFSEMKITGLSVLIAYNGFGNQTMELGIARNTFGMIGHHPYADAQFISCELTRNNGWIIGPKIGAWVGGGAAGMALGINGIYYTNFNEYSVRVRPELGVGFGKWKAVYGYNIPLNNSDMVGVNKHNFTFARLILFNVLIEEFK